MNQAIALYFAEKRREMERKAKLHSEEAKNNKKFKNPREYHEQQAWHYGVSMVTYLIKLEDEIQSVLRRQA